MESDSESALTLIAGKDVPKKSRHIEIRLHWMRSKIEAEELALKYKPGTENCSDVLTKCLGTKDFFRHRTQQVPVGDLNSLRDILLTGVSASVGQEMAFMEVCCSENSALRQACRLHICPMLELQRTCKNGEFWMKSRLLLSSRGTVEDGCMCSVQPRAVLVAVKTT